jgi:hypothetical protein
MCVPDSRGSSQVPSLEAFFCKFLVAFMQGVFHLGLEITPIAFVYALWTCADHATSVQPGSRTTRLLTMLHQCSLAVVRLACWADVHQCSLAVVRLACWADVHQCSLAVVRLACWADVHQCSLAVVRLACWADVAWSTHAIFNERLPASVNAIFWLLFMQTWAC